MAIGIDTKKVLEARSRLNKAIRKALQEDQPQRSENRYRQFMKQDSTGAWVADWDKWNLGLSAHLGRYVKLKKLELRDDEQELHDKLMKLGESIKRTEEPSELRKLFAVLDEVEPRVKEYIHAKTGKA